MAVLIGLIGYAGSGKDYAADLIEDMVATDNVGKYKFADPLKSFCRKVFNWTEDHTDGDLKEVPDDNGVIPRIAMQKLGAEWGRELNKDVWVEYTLNKIWRDVNAWEVERNKTGWRGSKVDLALVTDVRFTNEAIAIKRMGGYLIFLASGGSNTAFREHSSERSVDDTLQYADIVVDNRERNKEMLQIQLHDFLFGKVALKEKPHV